MSERFKYFEGTRTKLRSGIDLFHSRVTGKVSLVPNETAQAASLCGEFAELQQHARRIEQAIRNPTKTAGAWRQNLQQAVESGLLLPFEEIQYRAENGFVMRDRPRSIDLLGIPTRDRPEMLKRLLSGLSTNLQEFGRKAEVVVMDDSESPGMRALDQQVIAQFAGDRSLAIRYGNRETRRRFAVQLSSILQAPLDLVRFALEGAGPAEYMTSPGACRNSILLEAGGHCLLSVDDDMDCRFVVLPGSNEKIVLGTRLDSFWFFDNKQAVETCEFTREDLLGCHEKLLNTDKSALAAGVADGQVDFASVSLSFLKRLEKGKASIVLSFLGIAGDAGFDHPLPYFVLRRENLRRLTATENIYRAALQNRLVLRGPLSTFISDQMGCMSGCMGIDNTELLPPFLPVQRAEEFVWSWLINRCVPGALFGVAPRAILHRPADGRTFEPDAAVLNAGKFTTGETIAFLISAETVHGASRAELIRAMGSHLEELDCLEEGDFREHVRMASHAALLSWLQRLDAAMHDATSTESFWVEDVQRMKDECVRCLAERDYAVPFDLEQTWGVVEGRRRFRELLTKFAQLLRIWPDLVDQARALQANGITLCSP